VSRSFFGNIQYLKESLTTLMEDGWQIVIFADSENQSLRIGELLKDLQNQQIKILPESISAGFGIPSLKLLVIQENEIFGRRKHVPKSIKQVKSAVIDTFVELNPGDYVVHVNYGIGLFKGIERVRAMGNERDYIKLLYADEETVFIPIEQVNLVQRYIGNEGVPPRLDKLGSKSWENRKNKAKKAAEDIAQKLIDLYSRRKAARGFPFPKDTEWQTAFEAAFPYTETEDQLTVAAEVKADMEKPVPMDRLVCGDVGFGKTEIAMRAAFKAVMGGKQVAFLAPTTILAEQHYETCVERFENFPVRIAHMSRFVGRSEQKKILEKLATGEIDILVGTHRIIQKDVKFKDLGLMIIDEEQRFGVKDKERLKELKTNIDCMAMSATPIPRTLHMSLLKIRDMSLLTTPPHNRQAIETIIDSYNDDRVAAAIRREVERGGQVFYLHNRIETLEEVQYILQRLVPEMMVEVAHGQMTSTELDDIFHRFKMGAFHILVSTTIIENGIDIPNVNTIIIDRADMYGVSQLYQLRGRVGRSDRKAYAYLLYPENKALSEIAMKRLQVISDFTELGAGFKIAMKDMEIRGAGNLLGRDQSGEIFSVGFDLYLKLLEEAVQRLMDENYEAQNEVLLELEYTGFIPDTYIQNPQTKMEIYKKIAAVSQRETLDRIYGELQDRFGPIPDEVYSLLSLAEIRIICSKLNISTLRERKGKVSIEFAKVSRISVDKVLRLIREGGGRVKLDNSRPNVLILETGKIGLKEKSEFIREKLDILAS
ncbi:MAG: transcription-repair coupling factor, partial [Candidatus Treponema excrementipullorum]|nr:transcription-repair coupling factor [Candidatus Treponema excrementipullorum]